MEFPKISESRVWDLLIDDKFNKIEYIPHILNKLRQRVDNFNMLKVESSITGLVRNEYSKIMEILSSEKD